jgi:sugar lactone lactonase YvrE
MLTDCKPISPRPFLVAESPIWDDRRNCAFFVDIKGHALLSWDPQSRLMQEWPMGEDIGFVALTDSAELIVGRKSGLALFNPDKNEYRPFTGFRPAPNERLNDGKVDREGNLFFGTMHDQAAPECGVLYRLTPDLGFTKVATGYGVPNGPAFASDGVFFHCATDQGSIFTTLTELGGRPRRSCNSQRKTDCRTVYFWTMKAACGADFGAVAGCSLWTHPPSRPRSCTCLPHILRQCPRSEPITILC